MAESLDSARFRVYVSKTEVTVVSAACDLYSFNDCLGTLDNTSGRFDSDTVFQTTI
jgi:hypothetical protein